jgi:hypothetical protein
MTATYTSITKFLRRCFFNPRKAGFLTIIADVGNPQYYENRAIEFIREAQLHYVSEAEYDSFIVKAIQLLALAHETRLVTSHNKKYESENITKKTET